MSVVPISKVKMIDMVNRKGFACICLNNLTEGSTPGQAYDRMRKAVKRSGGHLPDATAVDLKKCLVDL